MDDNRLLRPGMWLAVLFAAGLAVYFAGLRIPYYGDDYQFVFDLSPQWSLHSFFIRDIPENGFYRPLQAAFLWIVQRIWGLDTLPVHLVTLGAHVLLSWLVFVFVLDLRFTRAQAAIASLFMLVSQAGVHAVVSNDTLSQVGSTLFGFLSLWLVFRAAAGRVPAGPGGLLRDRRYWLGLLALAASLLSKESGVVFFPMVAIVMILPYLRKGHRSKLKSALLGAVPYVLVTAAYLLVRSQVAAAQPGFGPAKYQFGIGMNILENAGMLIGAIVMPVSTVKAYVAARSGSAADLAWIAASTAVLLAAVCGGLWIVRRRWRMLLVMAAFMALGLVPVAILNHVSELYAYTVMPVAAALIGTGLGAWLESNRGYSPARAAAAGLVLILLAVNIVSIQSKTAMMKKSAALSGDLLKQIEPFLGSVPLGGKLLLLNPCDGTIEYSVFLVSGFNAVDSSIHRLGQIASRSDFSTEVADRCKVGDTQPGRDVLALTIEGGRVVVYNPLRS